MSAAGGPPAAAPSPWLAGLRALCSRVPAVAADPEVVQVLSCQVRVHCAGRGGRG